MRKVFALACTCAMLIAVPVAFARLGGRDHRGSDRRGDTAVCGLDKQWLKTSMQGDLFEITGGKIAKSKSDNAAVLRLANRLITDHTKSFAESAELARRLGVHVPDDPTPSQVWELKMVSSLSGSSFNHWYSTLEVYDHIQDIQEAQDEVSDGCNDQVRDDAMGEIPTLRIHLELAQDAARANP